MTGAEIKARLMESHRQFVEVLNRLQEKEYMQSTNGKWTAGQQLDHIYLSVHILVKALRFPKFLLRYKFGKANRPSRDYDGLVHKYVTKLLAGGIAPSPFVPRPALFENKLASEKRLLSDVEALCNRVDKYDEQQLDYYILPHPLLGKLTIREMLYFTIYHAEHHRQIALRNLGK